MGHLEAIDAAAQIPRFVYRSGHGSEQNSDYMARRQGETQ
jgi:hypothetical protein